MKAISRLCSFALILAAGSTGCWSPPPPIGDGGDFQFAVFGDGPYYVNELGRFRRVVEALNARPLAFVIHVGDIGLSCSDGEYRNRREAMDRIRHPVIYTPGDNEWSDCIDAFPGNLDPLERLASLRRIFFDSPSQSIGGSTLQLQSQASDGTHAAFPEHARWSHEGVLFATIHVVGGANGGRDFPRREVRHDEEVAHRTEAAIVWLHETFAEAEKTNAAAVVVAFHAGIFDRSPGPNREAYAPIYEGLVELAQRFGKPVLVIHGDNHTYTVDRPFRDPVTGDTIENLQRLQTFGSPDIGWVDVVVDTSLEQPFRFEPNVTPWWLWW